MKRQWSLLALVLLAAPLRAQAPPAAPAFFPPPVPPAPTYAAAPACPCVLDSGPAQESGPLTGNHNFPGFINFISNPLQNIDPRAVTAIYPLFGSAWVSSPTALPDVDGQVYGPALTVALSERLAVGINQGGYAEVHVTRGERNRIVNDPRFASLRPDLRDRLGNIANGGSRDGFLNLGGFAQYTLIEDVPNQFLLTGGVRLEVPCGSHEVFQGYGPAEMAPYLTVGKGVGEFHFLATAGYLFPIGPGSDNSQVLYANFHLDRRCFGWLYPLVELNCVQLTKSASFGLTTRRGFIDFDNFEATGNVVNLSAGVNAVLVPEHVEIGAVYTTDVATQRDLRINALLVKMTLRY